MFPPAGAALLSLYREKAERVKSRLRQENVGCALMPTKRPQVSPEPAAPIGRCEIPEGLVDYNAVNRLRAGVAGEVNVEARPGFDPSANWFALVIEHTPRFIENVSPWTVLVDDERTGRLIACRCCSYNPGRVAGCGDGDGFLGDERKVPRFGAL
jgi:hypothetical protein